MLAGDNRYHATPDFIAVSAKNRRLTPSCPIINIGLDSDPIVAFRSRVFLNEVKRVISLNI